MKEATGKDMSYLMLRGIFMAPGVTKEQADYYVQTLKKVSRNPGMEEVHLRQRAEGRRPVGARVS